MYLGKQERVILDLSLPFEGIGANYCVEAYILIMVCIVVLIRLLACFLLLIFYATFYVTVIILSLK